MSRRSLLLDYVPQGRGKPRPSLAVWKGARRTEVLGLGVQPGSEFDPLPFVGAFPADSEDVWVFAEWAFATQAMVEEGADLPEIEAWVREDSTAMTVSQVAAPTSRRALEGLFDTEWMATRSAATDALVFLAQEVTDATVQPGADVRILNPNGASLAVLEVKRSAPARERRSLYVKLRAPGAAPTTVELSEQGAGERIRAWLKAAT
jgi:hypothetical protein